LETLPSGPASTNPRAGSTDGRQGAVLRRHARYAGRVNRPISPARFIADQRARLLAAPPEWAAEDARVDRRVAIGSIIAMWALYFLITTTLAAITGASGQVGLMGRRALVVLVGTAFTFLLYLLLIRVQPRSFGARLGVAFGAAVPLTILYAIINLMAFFVWFPTEESGVIINEVQAKFPAAWQLVLVLDSSIRWYFFFAVWAALYVALGYANEMRAVERRANDYRLEAQTAQLRALHYQVNPHFLFNTLNSLSSLVLADRKSDAEAMIMNLSALLRTNLTADPETLVTLADEIALQRLYLAIEQARFPDRLRVDENVPADLENALVPVLILQPIIENAIKYGVSPTRQSIGIKLDASGEFGQLVISISNDIDPTAPKPAAGTGVGLNNVRDRLMTRYGARAGCEWGPNEAGGFTVTLWLPLNDEAG
jgi:two-component system, LytTR family, sensor kinase